MLERYLGFFGMSRQLCFMQLPQAEKSTSRVRVISAAVDFIVDALNLLRTAVFSPTEAEELKGDLTSFFQKYETLKLEHGHVVSAAMHVLECREKKREEMSQIFQDIRTAEWEVILERLRCLCRGRMRSTTHHPPDPFAVTEYAMPPLLNHNRMWNLVTWFSASVFPKMRRLRYGSAIYHLTKAKDAWMQAAMMSMISKLSHSRDPHDVWRDFEAVGISLSENAKVHILKYLKEDVKPANFDGLNKIRGETMICDREALDSAMHKWTERSAVSMEEELSKNIIIKFTADKGKFRPHSSSTKDRRLVHYICNGLQFLASERNTPPWDFHRRFKAVMLKDFFEAWKTRIQNVTKTYARHVHECTDRLPWLAAGLRDHEKAFKKGLETLGLRFADSDLYQMMFYLGSKASDECIEALEDMVFTVDDKTVCKLAASHITSVFKRPPSFSRLYEFNLNNLTLSETEENLNETAGWGSTPDLSTLPINGTSPLATTCTGGSNWNMVTTTAAANEESSTMAAPARNVGGFPIPLEINLEVDQGMLTRNVARNMKATFGSESRENREGDDVQSQLKGRAGSCVSEDSAFGEWATGPRKPVARNAVKTLAWMEKICPKEETPITRLSGSSGTTMYHYFLHSWLLEFLKSKLVHYRDDKDAVWKEIGQIGFPLNEKIKQGVLDYLEGEVGEFEVLMNVRDEMGMNDRKTLVLAALRWANKEARNLAEEICDEIDQVFAHISSTDDPSKPCVTEMTIKWKTSRASQLKDYVGLKELLKLRLVAHFNRSLAMERPGDMNVFGFNFPEDYLKTKNELRANGEHPHALNFQVKVNRVLLINEIERLTRKAFVEKPLHPKVAVVWERAQSVASRIFPRSAEEEASLEFKCLYTWWRDRLVEYLRVSGDHLWENLESIGLRFTPVAKTVIQDYINGRSFRPRHPLHSLKQTECSFDRASWESAMSKWAEEKADPLAQKLNWGSEFLRIRPGEPVELSEFRRALTGQLSGKLGGDDPKSHMSILHKDLTFKYCHYRWKFQVTKVFNEIVDTYKQETPKESLNGETLHQRLKAVGLILNKHTPEEVKAQLKLWRAGEFSVLHLKVDTACVNNLVASYLKDLYGSFPKM